MNTDSRLPKGLNIPEHKKLPKTHKKRKDSTLVQKTRDYSTMLLSPQVDPSTRWRKSRTIILNTMLRVTNRQTALLDCTMRMHHTVQMETMESNVLK